MLDNIIKIYRIVKKDNITEAYTMGMSNIPVKITLALWVTGWINNQ